MDWSQIINYLIGSGVTLIVGVLTIPSVIKKAKAEAQASVIDNIQRVADGWEKLSNERQEENESLKEECHNKDKKIDDLYLEIGEWRNKYYEKGEELHKLREEKAISDYQKCEKRGCADRIPPTGY